MAPIAIDGTHPGWYLSITFILALVPLLLGTTTSYLKLSLALGVLRNGFGAQQVPSNTVIMVLSLVLSLFIMQPTIDQVLTNLSNLPSPKMNSAPTIAQIALYSDALKPWRNFIGQHAGHREIAILSEIAKDKSQIIEQQTDLQTSAAPVAAEVPIRILLPAFVLSELKEGLMVGFVLLLPFLIVDLVVANILAGLGMYMMSPTIISLPLKLLLFVSVDGWLLMSRGFIASYGGVT